MLQLIYELRKNWRGRDGWTGEIEGSTRGPRGPKKTLQHLNLMIRTKMTIMMMTMVIMVKLIMTMTMIFVVVNNVFRRCLLDGSGYSLMCCEGRQLYVA